MRDIFSSIRHGTSLRRKLERSQYFQFSIFTYRKLKGIAFRADVVLARILDKNRPARSASLAFADLQLSGSSARRFSHGTRPVIRWIKGDGLDDDVTRAAIGQATRLFGSEVDYCLCTIGIDASRARSVLEWATQPVEWWPISPNDNSRLAQFLNKAGYQPEAFGYWWKWFPERVRPSAPEWILDGDMVITGRPAWFDDWAAGRDCLRMTQDDSPDDDSEGSRYGQYAHLIDRKLALYSGLVSLPPGANYMDSLCHLFQSHPLEHFREGRKDFSEQGGMAVALQAMGAQPIPLQDFPMAFRRVNFGMAGDAGKAWGYHFVGSFKGKNPQFARLTEIGTILKRDSVSLMEKFHWLHNDGRWGVPGTSLSDIITNAVASHAAGFAGKPVLEVGTSRGYLAAILASLDCDVTTIDNCDRGALRNLSGLPVRIVMDDVANFLSLTHARFDCIFVDIHGNTPDDWRRLAGPLVQGLTPDGVLIISNAELYRLPGWSEETGVRWFIDQLPDCWKVSVLATELPGVVIAQRQ